MDFGEYFKNKGKELFVKFKTEPFRSAFNIATCLLAVMFIIKTELFEYLIVKHLWQFALIYILLGQISMILDDKIKNKLLKWGHWYV